jgi:hypothetical protein
MPRVKRTWTPHPLQREIMTDGARFRAVPAGRRFGKTKMGRSDALEFGIRTPDSLVWLVFPSYDDARELGFEPVLKALPATLVDGAKDDQKQSPPREINLTNGTRFSFRSMTGKLRGRGVDYVFVDEAGDEEAPADMWTAQLRPALSDTLGKALLAGTPNGKGWFYEAYERGNDPEYSAWASWQATTYQNPHVPDSEVEAARTELPERVFRQEYLAEFVDDEGTVFGNVRERNVRPYALEAVVGEPPYATGVDLARTSNYLVATTLDTDGMLVGFERTRGGSWAAAGRQLTAYLDGFPGVAYLDATRDNKVIEDLAREVSGVQIEPVRFSPQVKQNMIENLAARLETQDVVLPSPEKTERIGTLLSELSAFGYEVMPSGNVRYGPPEGMNDDTVDALALAAKESRQARATF